jgi:hypothetical protein
MVHTGVQGQQSTCAGQICAQKLVQFNSRRTVQEAAAADMTDDITYVVGLS